MSRPSQYITRFLGENEILMIDGMPGSYKPLTDKVRNFFAAHRDEIISALNYIKDGEENGGNKASFWLKQLKPIEVPEGDTLKMDMKYSYTTFELSWEERDAFETETSDVEVRSMASAHNIGITIFYPYDISANKEERSCAEVRFWVIEWDARRAYTIDADMSDHSDIRTSLLPFLRYCKSVPLALEWLEVIKEYKAAKNSVLSSENYRPL